MEISKRIGKISPSLTLEITAKAKKMKAEGISVVSFGAGEPNFNTPNFIIQSAKEALDNGFTKYTPTSGIAELKDAVCKKFLVENSINYKPSEIVISSGAKSSLFHAISSILNEGEEVIIPSPYWLTYPEIVGLAGGKCVFIQTLKENGFKMTAEELEKAITDKTKCLILNSPNNPTGAVYSEKEIREIANVCLKHNIIVVSDEVYEKLIYENEKHFSIASISEEVKNMCITINAVSKSFSMTGWRIGYLGCPENVAKAINSMQSHTTSNACSISQYASATALSSKEGTSFSLAMKEDFDSRRKLMISMLDKIDGIDYVMPKGAFYVFCDVSKSFGKTYNGNKITGSMTFADNALKKGVAVIPGVAFGNDNYIRLSYAVSTEDIVEGLNRLKSFIKELK